MADVDGRELRRRRVALGLTLEQVALHTGIASDYIAALEDGALNRLPRGPYAEAYARTVRRCLERFESRGLPLGPDTDPFADADSGHRLFDGPTGPIPTPEGGEAPATDPVVYTNAPPPSEPVRRLVPMWALRAVAALSTTLFLGIVAWQGLQELQTTRQLRAQRKVDPIQVDIRMIRSAPMTVRVDGRLEVDGVLSGGQNLSWTAGDRIELEVPDLSTARVRFQGALIAPRGHQDRPRTLVFVNDGGR